MKKPTTCMALSLLAVAGCSGSSNSSPEIVGASEVSMGSFPSMLTVEYDETTDTITLSDGTTTTVLPVRADAAYDTPGFLGYFLSSFGYSYASRGETSSGSGFAIAVNSEDTASNVAGSVFGRTGDTTMPTSGTVIYTGDYVAWIALGSGPIKFLRI